MSLKSRWLAKNKIRPEGSKDNGKIIIHARRRSSIESAPSGLERIFPGVAEEKRRKSTQSMVITDIFSNGDDSIRAILSKSGQKSITPSKTSEMLRKKQKNKKIFAKTEFKILVQKRLQEKFSKMNLDINEIKHFEQNHQVSSIHCP